jgi:hypothetical protein
MRRDAPAVRRSPAAAMTGPITSANFNLNLFVGGIHKLPEASARESVI